MVVLFGVTWTAMDAAGPLCTGDACSPEQAIPDVRVRKAEKIAKYRMGEMHLNE